MKFTFKFTPTDGGEETAFPGGRQALWDAQDEAEGWPERKTNASRLDFAWGYFAAKRAGKLAELGVEGMDAEEAIGHIADYFDLHISDSSPAAPLAPEAE